MKVIHSSGHYDIFFQPIQLPTGIIVTDANVYKLYKDLFSQHEVVILEPGEHTKSLASYEHLCRTLANMGASRSTNLIAFGGGVIGDLVGFTASTYMRGIRYTQIPSTLLAQIDSSVGGKTGVDLPEGKNLVGAFYPPLEVQIDTSLLSTLPKREFTSGTAEIIKTGLIQSPSLAKSLTNNPLRQNDDRIQAIVEECVTIKARVVQEDEFETLGLRCQLNFGHTVGHALEQITNYSTYTHGEAIAVGMVVETMIAERLGLASRGLTNEVEFLMNGHELPTKAVELIETDMVISAMRKDKKSTKGELSMSLVSKVGECALVSGIDEGVVAEVLNEYSKV